MRTSRGGEYIPKCLRTYVYGKEKLLEFIRAVINILAKAVFFIDRRLSACDKVLFANDETKRFLLPLVDNNAQVMTEVGIDECEIIAKNFAHSSINFLVAGRLVYRKGIQFLLDVLATMPDDLDYFVNVVGNGPDIDRLRRQCNALGLNKHVEFKGSAPFTEMNQIYKDSDILILPSLRETTGTVIVEALSHGLPVIAYDGFGGKVILDDEVAWLYGGDSKDEIKASLRNILIECIVHRCQILKKSKAAKQKAIRYSWRNKYLIY